MKLLKPINIAEIGIPIDYEGSYYLSQVLKTGNINESVVGNDHKASNSLQSMQWLQRLYESVP